MLQPLCVSATSPPPIWWPTKLPGETLDQTFDTSTLPTPIPVGQIATLSAQIAPSGSGELSGAALTLTGTIITLTESSGVAGRVYWVLFSATLAGGEIVQWMINQGVGPIPPPNPIPPPPNPGFGTEITWMPTSNNLTTNELSANLVISTIPFALANIQANATSASGWVLLMDATEVPPEGTLNPPPIRKWLLQPYSGTGLQSFVPPLQCVRGAVLLFSSNPSPYTLTSSATADLSGEIA